MMTAKVNDSHIARMKAAIAGTGRRLRKELAIATNTAARKGKSIINKQIRTEMVIKAKDLRPSITVARKATSDNVSATIEVSKSDRISLRAFGPRQTRKGVTYRTSKTGGRKLVPGAFPISSWGGHIYKRREGTRRPTTKLRGPSPWGVFVVGKQIDPSVTLVQAELKKQIDRRIRFVLLKKSGEI